MRDIVVAAHLNHLQQRGQTADTVYCRSRALARLRTALGPNRPWTISHLCNQYLHEAGHPETLHSLRHRFATVTYQDSRDLLLVQGLLGHAQPSTTAGYARWDQAAASDVVARIPAPRHLKVVSE